MADMARLVSVGVAGLGLGSVDGIDAGRRVRDALKVLAALVAALVLADRDVEPVGGAALLVAAWASGQYK